MESNESLKHELEELKRKETRLKERESMQHERRKLKREIYTLRAKTSYPRLYGVGKVIVGRIDKLTKPKPLVNPSKALNPVGVSIFPRKKKSTLISDLNRFERSLID